jgi:2-dehydro-3-deoxygluconokinase
MPALNIRQDACALDFLALGAVVHRLDPGILPFRRARSFEIHVSGGEYNVAANLASCFGLNTGVATAMVDNGIGELVQSQIREMGVRPFYKHFKHDGVRGPNIATV